MNKHQSLCEIEGDSVIAQPDIFVGVKKYIMRVFVVAKLLFLLGYVHCDFYCLLDIANSPIEFKSPLGLFRLIINLTK